jgi:hypothetical protein
MFMLEFLKGRTKKKVLLYMPLELLSRMQKLAAKRLEAYPMQIS